jgi:hypothetical protein
LRLELSGRRGGKSGGSAHREVVGAWHRARGSFVGNIHILQRWRQLDRNEHPSRSHQQLQLDMII